MTPVLLALRAAAPAVGDFIRGHWRVLSVAALAVVAAMALRGCHDEAARADEAEKAAQAAAAQVAATFKAELARAYSAHEALAREVAKAQAGGARPVEVGEGTSERIRIVYRPAAPGIGVWGGDAPAVPVKPAAPGAPEDPSAPCVLALGDSVEFVAGTVTIAEKDGTRAAFVGVTLKRYDPDGDLVSGVIRAPLAPAEPRTSLPVAAPSPARFALRGGANTDLSPFLGGDLRIVSRLWGTVDASTAGGLRLGARWEW